MSKLPKKLHSRLNKRLEEDALRSLKSYDVKFDFSSNDYLGMAQNSAEFASADSHNSGATGSRLLTGNHNSYTSFENTLCDFHDVEAALTFNSGYDANLGLISAIGLRGDLILYDALAHASIRDGIQLAKAKSLKFRHNDLEHLEQLLEQQASVSEHSYVITESVFSMDGDSPDLIEMVKLCERYNAHLIVDEAHALGVFGERGEGLVQHLGLQKQVFARLVTFGKALGYHGAAVLGSNDLKSYLVNFARSLIYTTALPESHLGELNNRYLWMRDSSEFSERSQKLHRNIALLRSYSEEYEVSKNINESNSAIHTVLVPGNSRVKAVASQLLEEDFGVLPILAPTVPQGTERIRICLHSYNKQTEIKSLIDKLASILAKHAQ